MNSALSEFEKDHGEPQLTYKGSTVSCIPSTENRSMPLEIDGFELQVDLTLIVRKAVLPTKPQNHDPLRYGSKDYKILRVGEPASGSHWEIGLKDPNLP